MPKDPSKTEKATPKRRQKAREEGQVPKSTELNKFGILLLGVIIMRFMMGSIGEDLQNLLIWFLNRAPSMPTDPGSMYRLMIVLVKQIANMVLPILFIIAFAAYVINRVQVGSLWAPKVLEPKLKQLIDLPSGLQRMVSPESFIRMGRSIGGAFAVGIGPYLVLRQEMDNLLPLFHQTVDGVAMFILDASFRMVLYSLVPMALIAVADTVYSFWKYEDNIKMGKDEVKDERKQSEGDPTVKGKQREKMVAMSQRRMLQNVPKADVIITNPTHFAVALLYDPSKAPAPLVVAKGADHMAKKIREIARENKVPIRENKPLARALYDQVEVGDIIPETLYKAVATILARLRKLKKSGQ